MEGERTVLCFGDSNTHGTAPMAHRDDVRRFGPGTRWPGVMAAELGPGWRVLEEALPGRTTVHPDPIEGAHLDGLAALPMLLESHRPIDVLVVMLGTNDTKARFSVGPADIAASLERLVATTRQFCERPGRRQPRILLVSPAPVAEVGCLAEFFAGAEAKSVRLAGFVRASAERAGAAFLDAAEHIRVSEVDGVHFDEAAHAALGRAVAEAVEALVA